MTNFHFFCAKNNMFGFLTAFNILIPNQREGREALIYENYIRTGQGLPSNRIYRESSIDKRVRKELGIMRYKERLKQQVKLIRLMKKLLIKLDHDINDDELNQIRFKVYQLECKIEKAARAKDINCEDMLNMNKPDDTDDIQLEQIIRTAILNNINKEKLEKKISTENLENDDKTYGDNINIQSTYINIVHKSYDSGDSVFSLNIDKKEIDINF